MELSWLESLFYGLISGIAEFLPISGEAHRAILLKLLGAMDDAAIRLAVHLGALIALIMVNMPTLSKLNRERRIAAIPPKRRKRQPDMRSLLDLRILKTACLPLIVCFVLYPVVHDLHQRLWVLALLLIWNGLILYLPQFLSGANKESFSMSSLDALLIGLGGGTGVFPGISRVGAAASVGTIRGADRRYILDISLILCIPALIVLSLLDCFSLFTGLGGITFFALLRYITAGISAFASAYFGIYMIRFLAVRSGFTGFAYYSWGLALFSFILYLAI